MIVPVGAIAQISLPATAGNDASLIMVRLFVQVLMQQLFPGEVFANTADFDTSIRQMMPRYDEMLTVISRSLPSTSQRILELGCGTGELSLKILKRYPDAQVIALDYSPRMLQFAQGKITASGYQQRWTGIEADFGNWANNPEALDIGREFDACVSSLAIHHLKDEMKLKLFQRIRQSLSPAVFGTQTLSYQNHRL